MGLTDDIVKANEKIKKLGSHGQETEWRKPIELFATTEKDSIKQAYKRYCKILDKDWRVKSQVVSEILELFKTYIRDKMSRAPEKYGEILLHDFYFQGSSREGLKVHSFDEFDVLIPFSFRHHGIGLVTTSDSSKVPPRHVIMHVENPSSWFGKYHLLDSNGCLLSRSVHECFIRGLIDEAVSAIKRTLEQQVRGENAFTIEVKTNPPAITLHIEFENNYLDGKTHIDVDLVPGMLMGSETPRSSTSRPGNSMSPSTTGGFWGFGAASGGCGGFGGASFGYDVAEEEITRKTETEPMEEIPNFSETSGLCARYAVARWFHKTQKTIFPLPEEFRDILWKISYSAYEIQIFDSIRTNIDPIYVMCPMPTEGYFVTAARVIKGLRSAFSEESDHYKSVYKSYYLKNILLYTLLYFTKIHETQISGVTEALACFVEMCRITFKHKKLPFFFVSSSNLQRMLFGQHIPGLSHELDLYEGIRVSIPSILKEFNDALRKAGIEDQKEILAKHKDIFMEFENHVS